MTNASGTSSDADPMLPGGEPSGLLSRRLVEAAPDALVGIDPAGRIALVNTRTEQLFGYPRGELIGASVDLLTPDGAAALRAYLDGSAPEPAAGRIELLARRRDGSQFAAELSLSVVESDHGRLALTALRDTSDRQREAANFRGLLETAPDAMVAVGADGRILLVNAQAERLFGYAREELIGERVEVLVPDASRDVHSRHRDTYAAHPVARPMGAGMDLAARRRDGTTFPAEISLSAIETEKGLLVSAAIRDITERLEEQAERERLRAQAQRERLERQMHQSQRLESLGQLAGGVAHDFNNLLGVILNYAAFVREEVGQHVEGGEIDWRSVDRDLTEIQRAAERATRLTHQLLVFGRREVAQPVVLSVNDVLRDMERLLKRALGEHVELVTLLTDDLWQVKADPGQLEQVLVNLAVNARDAMPGGGQLVLESQNVVVDQAYVARRPGLTAGPHVRLRVSDTGSGMDREVAARAFEPFFTTKPKGEGSGLGLATVYGIVKQAGGDAEIYSEPGIGTTISVMLPVTEEAIAAAPQAVDLDRCKGGETVLVVEDEPAMRELTRRILARNGYRVIVAGGGALALREAEQYDERIDLLLTDVVMPQMLGKDVAERVAALRPDIRVLFMSGYAQPILGSTGTLEEGVTLLEKPFSEAQLLEKVREVLDAGRRTARHR
jgi:PAS domain S-box-containing protein